MLVEGVTDTRKHIKETKIYPYSPIGIVSGIIENKSCFGTGCLIRPNLVLTCAHNCYYRDGKSPI